MAIAIERVEGSQRFSHSTDRQSAEFAYVVKDAATELEARAALLAIAPAFYDRDDNGLFLLKRYDVNLERVGETDYWQANVVYRDRPIPRYSFETGGGTRHIKVGLSHVASYAPTGQDAPNHRGAINVTPDGVEGTDIIAPVYQFAESHTLSALFVTQAYKGIVYGLTGRTNNKAWRGFGIGEVLFLGASGTTNQEGNWEIDYQFAATPTEGEREIGDVTVPTKRGWDFAWVEFEPALDATAKRLIRRPIAVHVERVYRDGDFLQLGIGG